MELFSSDIKNLILKFLSGKDILALSLTSKTMNRIFHNSRYNNIWKLKMIEDFGIHSETQNCFFEYKKLYKEYQTIYGYPEISYIYKKFHLERKVKEWKFIEDVLIFREQLQNYISNLNVDDQSYQRKVYDYFITYCLKYDLTLLQYEQFANIFDFFDNRRFFNIDIIEYFVENENELIN